MSQPDLEALTQAVRQAPKQAPGWLALGKALRSSGRTREAADALLRAVRLMPSWPEASYQLGLALDELGELEPASICYERACQLEPRRFELQRTLAFAYVRQGDTQRALAHYEQALSLAPKQVAVMLELSALQRALGQIDKAVALYRRAIKVDPTLAEVHNDLGNALYGQGEVDAALDAYNAALAQNPDYAEAHANLGNAQKDVCLHDEALASYRRALALAPQNAVLHASLLFTLSFHPTWTARAIFEEAEAFGKRHTEPLRAVRSPHANARQAERKLRIGYVSSDFRAHVSRFYLDALLRHHDRSALEIYCYSNVFPPDTWTERYRGYADNFRDIWGLDDATAAEAIRADGIDILVDLTMHSGSARPLLFARKPAPVQICWLAYVGTTGNDAMDYRITDPYLDPPGGDESVYTERCLRLPSTFWCYDALESDVPVAPLPASQAGHITFGCLGSFCKVNAKTLGLWARVLKRVDRSRLLMHTPPGRARERTLALLGREGISRSAVTFTEHLPRPRYLHAYAGIDVCLDTLPYNGLSNTLDAAWMGVPTLTLIGETVVGRAALSVAMNLDLPQLVARTPEELVAAAATLTSDLPALQRLRAGLRERLRGSPLMDAPRFARDLETAYREAWRAWCAKPTA